MISSNTCRGFLCAALTLVSSMVYAQTTKTILIIIDGIPSDLIESVSTPGIDAVAGESGYTRSWVGGERGGKSESPTVSAVGYNHLITGTWSNKHNVYNNRIDEPNYDYWDLFRIAKTHDASLHTAIFSTWTDNRTKLIGDGLPEAGGTKLDYAFDGFEHDTDQFPHDLNSDYIRQIDTHVSRETARWIDNANRLTTPSQASTTQRHCTATPCVRPHWPHSRKRRPTKPTGTGTPFPSDSSITSAFPQISTSACHWGKRSW